MTLLEGVNFILKRSGLGVVSSLQTGSAAPAGFAERFIHEESMAIQAQGWPCNVFENIELSPDLYSFTNAAYTAQTFGITDYGQFLTASVGQTIDITAGAATLGEAIVASVDSGTGGDFVNLTADINGGVDLASGVAGTALTNRIALPDSCLWIDADDRYEWRDLVQSGAYLYDRGVDENTNQFSDSVIATYCQWKSFGCLPFTLQRYILCSAAVEFCQAYGTEREWMRRRGTLHESLREAQAAAFRERGHAADVNVLDSADAHYARGGRVRRTTFSPTIAIN